MAERAERVEAGGASHHPSSAWPPQPTTVLVGVQPPAEMVRQLVDAGVHTNDYADVLLADPRLWSPGPGDVRVVVRSVAELGFPKGAGLFEVFAAARGAGLALCPADTAVALRLAWLDQPDAPDSVLSAGRTPTASITVAAEPLDSDHERPKGLYLRRVDGVLWLRGYRCDDTYQQPPGARFAFCLP